MPGPDEKKNGGPPSPRQGRPKTHHSDDTSAPPPGQLNTPLSSSCLEAALHYAARRGWKPIPCEVTAKGVKKPRIRWKTGSERDHPTGEPEQLRRWWSRFPTALVGILTGAASRVAVLDIDHPFGHHGKDGFATMRRLEAKHGELPITLTVRSPSGGLLKFFEYPSDLDEGCGIKSTAGVFGKGCGVDVRGVGGIVLLPPSRGPRGQYVWDGDPDEAIELLPAWLLPYIIKRACPKTVTPRARHVAQGALSSEAQSYLEHGAEEGNRNDSLFKTACELQSAGYTREEAEERLIARARANGLEDSEIQATINSAFSRERTPNPSTLCKDPTPDAYRHTDIGNAERLLNRHGKDLRFTEAAGIVVWDGTRWRPHRDEQARGLAVETVRAMYQEVEILKKLAEQDVARADELRKRAETLWGHARGSERSARLSAMLDVARGVASNRGTFVWDFAATFDSHPMLLNCPNGTLDLATGKLREHRRSDFITKVTSASFREDADCPRWIAFLYEIFDGNEALVRFMQRSIGYSLTGEVREQCLWFLHGKGANGKSTFIGAILAMLGDYGLTTSTDTLMVRRGDHIPNDIARMRGARFIAAKETEEGKQLAEVLVKELTGGDKVAARFLRQEWFEFQPECKIFVSGNYKPVIRGTDEGIWRRLHLVPFSVTIPKERRDEKLPEKLRAELPGMLAWSVRGCLDWQRDGLKPPELVAAATAAYREDQDILGRWLHDSCEVGEGHEERAGELYRSYALFCEDNGLRPVSNVRFPRQLEQRPGLSRRTTREGSIWSGLRLTGQAQARVREARP